jgi:hypothetical protein
MSTKVVDAEWAIVSFYVSLQARREVQEMVDFGVTFATEPDSAQFVSIAQRMDVVHAYALLTIQDRAVYKERREVSAGWPVMVGEAEAKTWLFLPIRDDGSPVVRWKMPQAGGGRQRRRLEIALEEITEQLGAGRVRDEYGQLFVVYTYAPTTEAM